MVWAGVSLGYRTELHIFRWDSMTAVRYRVSVKAPAVRLYVGVVGSAFVLMDDNASPYRVVLIQDYLKSAGISRIE